MAVVGVSPLGPAVSEWSRVDGREILFELRGKKSRCLYPWPFLGMSVQQAFDELKMKNPAFVQWKVKGQLESFKQELMGGVMNGPVYSIGANLDRTRRTRTAPLMLTITWLWKGQRIRVHVEPLGESVGHCGAVKGKTVELWHTPICSR